MLRELTHVHEMCSLSPASGSGGRLRILTVAVFLTQKTLQESGSTRMLCLPGLFF